MSQQDEVFKAKANCDWYLGPRISENLIILTVSWLIKSLSEMVSPNIRSNDRQMQTTEYIMQLIAHIL